MDSKREILMKYVIIHGYGSSPETSNSVRIFKEMISEYDGNAEIITPTYDVFDIQRSVENIMYMVDHHTIVIGISLGGFIARYVANMSKAFKLLMVNPSIHAYENLKKYPEITDVCHTFKPLYIEEDIHDLGIMVLLAMDDDVVDPIPTYNLYRDRAIVIHSDGGHRMTTLPTLDHYIFRFLNTING